MSQNLPQHEYHGQQKSDRKLNSDSGHRHQFAAFNLSKTLY
jgi:hypothetical protein